MKRVILGGVAGFVAGVLLVSYLAQRASGLFFWHVRQQYELEEDIAASCARQRGAMNEAALHHANVLATRAGDGWWAWDETPRAWTFWFPFGSKPLSILRAQAEEDTGPMRSRIDAMYRAMLADDLEKAGRRAEAEKEHARAAAVLGAERERRFLRHGMDVTMGGLGCSGPQPYTRALMTAGQGFVGAGIAHELEQLGFATAAAREYERAASLQGSDVERARAAWTVACIAPNLLSP